MKKPNFDAMRKRASNIGGWEQQLFDMMIATMEQQEKRIESLEAELGSHNAGYPGFD